MDITIAAVGSLGRDSEQSLHDYYLKHINNLAKNIGIKQLKIVEISEDKSQSAMERCQKEGEKLLQKIPNNNYLILLDEKGENLSTMEFTKIISKNLNIDKLVFAIGGPDGHGINIKSKANKLISFGKMTWPHKLVRVMLVEQIYRAVQISRGHPYHRS